LDCCSAQLSMTTSSANVAEDGGGQVWMFHVHLVHTKPFIMFVLCSNQYTVHILWQQWWIITAYLFRPLCYH
jgi:hypothetical protein